MCLRTEGMLGFPERGYEFNLADHPRIVLSAAEALRRELSGWKRAFADSFAFHGSRLGVAVDGHIPSSIGLFF